MSRTGTLRVIRIHVVVAVISSCLTQACARPSQSIVAAPMQQGSVVLVSHEDASGSSSGVTAGDRAYRWSRPGTLRLWVQPWTDNADQGIDHGRLVDEAIAAWTRSDAVHIARVSWPMDADIRLYWSDRLPPSNPGVTMLYSSKSGHLTRADVFVSIAPAPWHIGTPDRVLYATIAHELGHALGLPHDPSPRALMHPAPLVTSVTEEDLAHLSALVRGGT